MQASTSGLWVHISHDITPGSDLRLEEAKPFWAELGRAIADVERAHAEVLGGVGIDISGTPPEDEGEGAEVVGVDEVLHTLTRKQLDKLAEDKGVDLSGAKTKADVIEALS